MRDTNAPADCPSLSNCDRAACPGCQSMTPAQNGGLPSSPAPLEAIGFYTLSDRRAAQASRHSPLWRCELIVTDRCNFACPYCRGVEESLRGDLSYAEAVAIVDRWADEGLRNIRFSGGEPTVWKGLVDLVAHAKARGIERIALSTNGSVSLAYYEKLIDAGVNDFSISLDACCAETGDAMAGGKKGAWARVVANIAALSRRTYVTVGVVLTETNAADFGQIVEFADSLGVADIRVITAAQWDHRVTPAAIPEAVLARHPVLRYRMQHLAEGRYMRGLREGDSHRCGLVLDDMAVLKGHHYPCIIYLREQGRPIGRMTEDFRAAREAWWRTHDTHADPICRANCLDVCVDYNNRHAAGPCGSPDAK